MGDTTAADAPWEQQVTPQERRFVYSIRYTNILRAWVHTACLVAYNQKYLLLCGHDTGVMAIHAGLVRSLKSVVNVLMSPVVGALSDSFGRKPVMLYGRVGWVLIWLALPNVASLRQWLCAEIIFTGVLRAGDNASQQAAMADLFGTRAQLSTQIASKDGMYAQLSAFFGPIIGYAWARLFGRQSTFYCSALLSALSMILLCRTEETLKPEKRKPFSIRRANPIASMTLLFRLDKGLRALAISQFLKDLSGSLMSVLNMFRMGPMMWSPQNVSTFKQFISPTIGFFQGTMVSRVVGRLGLKRGFEVSSLVSALGFIGWSQVWRSAAHGARGWWLAASLYALVYVGFISVMPTVANLTMKSMIVKHGTLVSGATIGNGELASAMEGLNLITGILLPPVSGALYNFFLHPPVSTPQLLRWGAGGSYLVGALIYLLSTLNMCCTNPGDLYVEDDGRVPALLPSKQTSTIAAR